VVAFYVRRALRLLPAVVVLLLGVAALSIVTSANEDQIPVTFLVVLSYSTNWAELAGVHISQYVSHLWSLAIEEQFYLVWPLLLFAGLVLVGSRSRLVWVALTLALLAAAWRAALWESGEGWLRIYIRSDARADALLIGAALALAPWERLAAAATTRWRTFAGVFSLGCVIAAAEFIQPSSPSLYLGGLSVVAVLCAVSLAAVLVPGSALAAVLASVPLVLLGRVSYGLYLWHFPIFLYVGEHARTWPAGARVAFAWALAIAVTVFSYRVVEQPALRLRGRLSARLAENVQAAP
jgi:peptidoglycan/LPS O-acetylase OafA/YrhL